MIRESRYLKFLKWIYFWAIMLYISGATYLVEIDWLLIPVTALGFYCFNLKKLKWDGLIFIILLVYTLINIGSIVINGDDDFSIIAFWGFYFRILIPYFLLKIFGDEFFVKYERIVYYGAFISLFCFAILIFDPYFYTKYLSDYNMSSDIRKSVGYWNCFIYTTHGGDYEIRNDGFAIEPGHFGFILGVAIFFNLMHNHFKVNKRLVVMVIAGLTTLSTTFFLTLGLFLYFYFLNVRTSVFAKAFTLFLFIGAVLYSVSSEIVAGKIEKTNKTAQDQFAYGYGNLEIGQSMNRFGAFQIESLNFLGYPLGYGVNNSGRIRASDGDVVSGPNGFATFFSFWGIAGIVFLFYSLYKFSLFIRRRYQYSRGLMLFPIIFLMYLFSNAISRDVLVFSLLLYPLIYNYCNLDRSEYANT